MKVRYLSTLAATAGVLAGGQAYSQDPARLTNNTSPVSTNQKLADTVAGRLTSSGVAAAADLTIVAKDGIVTLTGVARDADQRQQIIREVQRVSGVTKIRDGINTPAAITPVKATEVSSAPTGGMQVPAVGPIAAQPIVAIPPGAGCPSPAIEPAPVGAPGAGAIDAAAPPLPPYAWPTYAPYNNVSRVGYPQAYPYNAFPFIGPYYPFPKVPLGWRKVLLEWEDGFWWIGKVQSPQDYWRVRFW